MKQITISQFLTPSQIRTAKRLKKADEIRKQIIEPHLEDINKKLGQQNDASYLSYMVEYVVTQEPS